MGKRPYTEDLEVNGGHNQVVDEISLRERCKQAQSSCVSVYPFYRTNGFRAHQYPFFIIKHDPYSDGTDQDAVH